MQFDVKIRKVIENSKPLKALASVTVDGSFTIHNVRVKWKLCTLFRLKYNVLWITKQRYRYPLLLNIQFGNFKQSFFQKDVYFFFSLWFSCEVYLY